MRTVDDLDDLLTWLRAQLDEEERLARETGDAWIPLGPNPDDPRPIARLMSRYSPARVLAEVDAKRRILDEHDRAAAQLTEVWMWNTSEGGYRSGLYAAVRLLALPYADRPGYRDEWKPE